jgi:hypothetical protein
MTIHLEYLDIPLKDDGADKYLSPDVSPGSFSNRGLMSLSLKYSHP